MTIPNQVRFVFLGCALTAVGLLGCGASGGPVAQTAGTETAGAQTVGTSPAAGEDGAALYTQYCTSCHGDKKKGTSAAAIQDAIDKDVGKMGSLKSLTPAQIAAIAAAH